MGLQNSCALNEEKAAEWPAERRTAPGPASLHKRQATLLAPCSPVLRLQRQYSTIHNFYNDSKLRRKSTAAAVVAAAPPPPAAAASSSAGSSAVPATAQAPPAGPVTVVRQQEQSLGAQLSQLRSQVSRGWEPGKVGSGAKLGMQAVHAQNRSLEQLHYVTTPCLVAARAWSTRCCLCSHTCLQAAMPDLSDPETLRTLALLAAVTAALLLFANRPRTGSNASPAASSSSGSAAPPASGSAGAGTPGAAGPNVTAAAGAAGAAAAVVAAAAAEEQPQSLLAYRNADERQAEAARRIAAAKARMQEEQERQAAAAAEAAQQMAAAVADEATALAEVEAVAEGGDSLLTSDAAARMAAAEAEAAAAAAAAAEAEAAHQRQLAAAAELEAAAEKERQQVQLKMLQEREAKMKELQVGRLALWGRGSGAGTQRRLGWVRWASVPGVPLLAHAALPVHGTASSIG